jgi:hypothetical protein
MSNMPLLLYSKQNDGTGSWARAISLLQKRLTTELHELIKHLKLRSAYHFVLTVRVAGSRAATLNVRRLTPADIVKRMLAVGTKVHCQRQQGDTSSARCLRGAFTGVMRWRSTAEWG